MTYAPGLVSVRTPTYKRPAALRRALQSLIEQSWPNWVVDVFDDDPDQAGRAICNSFSDSRINYHHNEAQRFASKNIDQCFSSSDAHGAEFYCVLEDDNSLLPDFMSANIELCREKGVEIVLRNQYVEHLSGTDHAHLSQGGVLDYLLVEGLYEPTTFRMSLLVGIGVSNGGLFWSRRCRSGLEIQFKCTATMQEYLRTFSIREPIYVAMEPLAVWAENAEQTTRNAELRASYLRRELDLKRHIQALQQIVWASTPAAQRERFMTDRSFVPETTERSRALTKALILHSGGKLPFTLAAKSAMRGLLIRLFGRLSPEFAAFVRSRQTTSVPLLVAKA